MLCSKVRDLLPDYSVGIVDGRTRQEVDSHLVLCSGCRAEVKALDDVMLLVEQQGALEPPPGLFNAVRNRIEAGDLARESPAWWAFLWSRPARGAALAMSMAAVVLGLMLPAPRPSAPTLEVHSTRGAMAGELASSIRQHAMSAGEGPLADRVAWEAMAQLATQERDPAAGSTDSADDLSGRTGLDSGVH